jgi:hypothetical protein
MARIRTIKPSFYKNEQLADLPMSARILFTGLWCLSDRDGRLEDRPKRIKAEIFPYDTVSVDELLERLQSAGFITRYEVGDLKVIQIINFLKHQRITGKEAETPSELPELQDTNPGKQSGNIGETPEKTGREGKGKEGKGVMLPPTLDELKDYCELKGYSRDYGDKIFEYYNVSGWHDSRGKPVKNWKQKLISTWFKEEYKLVKTPNRYEGYLKNTTPGD